MRNLKQFLHTTWDVFRIYWEIAPFLTLGELITQIFISLQTLAYAYVFGIALDKIIDLFTKRSTDIAHLLPIIILFVFLDLIYSILGRLNSYFSGLLGNIDQGKIRLKETDILATLGISQLEDPEITNKTTRFNEVYSSMSQHLTQLMDLVSMLLTIISLGVVVFVFTPAVVVLFILFFGVKYFNNSRYIKKLWLLRRNTTEESRIAWSSIYSLGDPSSLKEISISGGAALLRNKFISYVFWFYKEYRKIRTRWLLFELSQSVLDTVFYGVGIYFLVISGIEQAITIGTLTFYLRSLGSFSEQLNSFSYRFSRLIESSIRLQDALELFEVYKPEGDGKLSLPFSKIPPTISISDLIFQYPNGQSPVIKNLDLTVASGEKIAIVGENGAGKTTLVKLIAGIYIASQGEILINGKSLRQLNRKSWYKHLGVLFQDFNTYGSLSAIENIHIGKVSKKLKREAIWKALGKADATNFVKKYPRQLDQLLSERYKGGLRPSGGQWQKIAIARIFYRNAPVLILDEPTASIDAVSEAKIFDNVYKFMKGKTVIIISHRFSTVRNADRIIVLDKGKIIEQGSHEQLLKMDGKYAKAFKLQARGYQ